MLPSSSVADIAVITGVGQSDALADLPAIDVPTPYGSTSEPIRLARIDGRDVAFLARRGRDEHLQPHRVPYRANVWALASLGATALITSTASSSLRDAFPPGTFVVPDQFIDRTDGRSATYLDGEVSEQLSAADPFDNTLRELAVESLSAQGVRVRDFGTAVVINGPRLPTRAETRWHTTAGGDLTNMTMLPEATLAHELGMAVVNISFITDRENTPDTHGGLSHLDLMRLRAHQAQPALQGGLTELVRRIPKAFNPPSAEASARRTALLARMPARP